MSSERAFPKVPDLPHDELLSWFRSLSTEQLKAMWDCVGDDYHVYCDEIYTVMQERGEGRYVAV